MNLCYYPSDDGSNCPNSRISDSFHCLRHAEAAKKLYKKYKKAQEKVDRLLRDKLNSIYKWLTLYSAVYEECRLRNEHQKTFFHPDHYDIGHTIYLKYRQELIRECEKEIEGYLSLKETPKEPETEEESTNIPTAPEVEKYKKVKSNLAEEHRLFQEMFQIRKKWLKKKKALFKNLEDQLKAMFPQVKDKITMNICTWDKKPVQISITFDALTLGLNIMINIMVDYYSCNTRHSRSFRILKKVLSVEEIMSNCDDRVLEMMKNMLSNEIIAKDIKKIGESFLQSEGKSIIIIYDEGFRLITVEKDMMIALRKEWESFQSKPHRRGTYIETESYEMFKNRMNKFFEQFK